MSELFAPLVVPHLQGDDFVERFFIFDHKYITYFSNLPGILS